MGKQDAPAKKEIVVTYHGHGGTWRTAYRSAKLAIIGMQAEMLGDPKRGIQGATIGAIYERDRKTNTDS